jgi:hypothetical protein
VGAQERGLGGDLGGQPEGPRLVLDGEPVAALHLHRGGALTAHLREEGPQPGAQVVVGRRPGRGDRAADPAAVVPGARHPRLELPGPVAGEDQVGMAVDEAGDHRAPAHVDPLVGVWRTGRRADPRDGSGLDHHGRAGHDAQWALAE